MEKNILLIGTLFICLNAAGCDSMAVLFHGEKPAEHSSARYTLSFDANGAAGIAPKTETYYGGLTVSLPDADALVYSGNAFDGWDTNTVGTGTRYAASSSFKVTADITFYAAWRRAAGDTNGPYIRSAWKDSQGNRVVFGGWRAWITGPFWADNNGKTLESEYRAAKNDLVLWTDKSAKQAYQFTVDNNNINVTTGNTKREFFKEE